MNKKRCICQGQDPHILLSAFYGRARKRIAAGVVDGQPPPAIGELSLTVKLIRSLAAGGGKAPFQAKFAHLDLHLEECPCSPSYAPSGNFVEA
jgi:hypothetical protein